MVRLPPPIDPAKERELQGTPELATLQRKRKAELDALFPRPDIGDIKGMYDEWRASGFTRWHRLARNNREVRYLHDKLPDKQQRLLQDGRRFYSRLSHNEILRTASMQCRNDYKVQVLARGTGAKQTEDARKRATKQSRFLQSLRGAMERKAGRPLRRMVVDGQHGDSLGAWEIYRTDAYDKLGIEERREGESDREYLDRTEELLQGAGLPFGIRPVDMTGLYYDEDDEGVVTAMIVERRPRKAEARRLRMDGKISAEKAREMMAPRAGESRGQPIDGAIAGQDPVPDSVECWRFYDHRWYAYVVDGEFIDEPREHGLPGCPIVLVPGIPTGSPNLGEALQGVTWGLTSMEVTLNDLMTKAVDNAFTYGRPKPVIETMPGHGRSIPQAQNNAPPVLDLSQPGVPYLGEGQKVVDAFSGFQPMDTGPLQQQILGLFQRSGLNPIAQGESPGADAAGYTVNTLQNAAQNLYEVLLDNEARAWERVCDFIRLMIRDTIRETVYLSVPMGDGQPGGTEWLGLSPGDIDETPCVVTIDPMSDVNRLAARQSLIEGNQAGYISREKVQRDGYGIDDPAAEDNKLALEAAQKALMAQAVEEAMAIVRGAPQQAPAGSGLVDQFGRPLPSSGGAPGAPNAPTVGAEQAAASQGARPVSMNYSTATAGQDRGYAPPGAGAQQ